MQNIVLNNKHIIKAEEKFTIILLLVYVYHCNFAIKTMRIISYSPLLLHYEYINSFIDAFNDEATHLSFIGSDQFDSFLKNLQEKDTIIVYCLTDIFLYIESFLLFLRFTKSHDIRLISISDEIDSEDKVFSLPSSGRIIEIISILKKKKSDSTPNDIESDLFSESKHDRMLKRHSLVINLYSANYKIKDILILSGYKSKKNIYLILSKYNINIRYPQMRRSVNKSDFIDTERTTVC